MSDAARRVPDGPWDLVLCRNVVIYLETPAAELLFSRIAATLSPGGFLIVGKAERPASGLKLSPVARCVYRRVNA